MDEENVDIKKSVQERLVQLPKVVQDAIASADTSKRLRELADTHKLHLDQWQVLENEVMLTLLGFQEVEDLEKNIKDEVGVSDEIAAALAADISRIVFEPIREELERQLDHPAAQAKEVSAVETAGAQAISAANAPETPSPATPAVVPAPITAPATAPDTKAVRAPISEVYKPGEASTTRTDVHNDPYREPPA